MTRSTFLPDLSPIGNQRGVALLAILAIVILLTFLGTVAIITSKTEMDISGVGRTEKKAFYAAEAGVEKVIGLILENYQTHGIPPEPLPSGEMDVNGYTVTYGFRRGGIGNLVITRLRKVYRNSGYQQYGFSVRCVRD